MSGLDEFDTVRVLCRGCGWFRVLGYTGTKGTIRALVRIASDDNAHNILRGSVREVPIDQEPGAWPADFVDLARLAQESGLGRAQDSFRPLVAGRVCPRCGQAGALCVDWYVQHGGDPLVERRRTKG